MTTRTPVGDNKRTNIIVNIKQYSISLQYIDCYHIFVQSLKRQKKQTNQERDKKIKRQRPKRVCSFDWEVVFIKGNPHWAEDPEQSKLGRR